MGTLNVSLHGLELGNAVLQERYLLVGVAAREVAVTAVIIAAIDLSSKTVKATFDGDSLQGVGGLVCDGHLVYGTSHKLNGVFMIRTTGGRGESPKVVEMAPLVRCDGGSLGMAGRPQGIAMRRRRGRAADGQASLFVTDYDGGRVLRLEVGACPLGSAALNGVQLSVLIGSRGGVAVESDAPAQRAQLHFPRGITIASSTSRTLYVSDSSQIIKALDLGTDLGQNGSGRSLLVRSVAG